jgi:hypothetical protein
MAEKEEKISLFSALRFFTPIISGVTLFTVGMLLNRLDKLDDKMFKHLTNDEMHSPRSIIVTKPEFMLYQQMRDRQMADLKDGIQEIKIILREHDKVTRSAFESGEMKNVR